MSVLDQATKDQLLANVSDPMGFKLAQNSLQRSDLLTESGLQGDRLQRDYDTYDRPDLLSSQAARGAFATSATMRKDSRLGGGLERSLGDLSRNTQSGLNRLTLRDIGATIPGVDLGI